MTTSDDPPRSGSAGLIPFRTHVLSNGLRVVLHEDHSEPVVAVYVYYHVGSSREEPGRSGFAHLFEHMLFQGSEHVADNDHFRLIQEVGGTLNGTTNQDRTNYFETLPSEELDLALWLESDRMGFLLPAMTQAKLDNQRDVVMNERRQSYENRPYGLVHETLLAALYPPGHPYSWPTIGSMADIAAATLEDVRAFFHRYYGPGNATLAIGGDIDPEHALERVEHWFGGLPPGPVVARPAPQPAGLLRTRRVVLEDRVQLPQLSLCWPTVHNGHPDEAALDLLADVLSANRSSVLDRALMIDEELASLVTIAHATQERAGALYLNLRPHAGVTLSELERRVHALMAALLERGIDAARLARLQRRREGELLRSLETVSERTAQLGFGDRMHGDPARIDRELADLRAVSAADLARVLDRYLVARPHVALSTVPRGRHDLAAAERAPEERAPLPAVARAGAPAGGTPAPFRSPPIWSDRLANGIRVLGAHFERVPLTRLSLALPAGRAYEGPHQSGLARLVGEMLEEGSRTLSGTEFLDTLDGLGATLSVQVGDEELVLRLSVLDECLPRALELLCDLVLEPRFDARDFARVRRARLVEIDTRSDRIGELADDGFARLIHGPEHFRGRPRLGRRADVAAATVEDVRAHWQACARPEGAHLCVVGAHDPARVRALFAALEQRWPSAAASRERHEPGSPPQERLALHFLDKPGAAQSELRIGHRGVASSDPAFHPLQALNHVVGGAFSSRLNLNLREDKGYTYGIRSAFTGGRTPGAFRVECAVASDVTAPAVAEILGELRGLAGGVRPAELEFTRTSMSRALARSLESSHARLALLESIAFHGHPLDVLERRHAWLQGMRAADLDTLARLHVRPESLSVLVVGARETVLAPLEALGLGAVHELEPAATPVPAR